jgi:hypothetical protein
MSSTDIKKHLTNLFDKGGIKLSPRVGKKSPARLPMKTAKNDRTPTGARSKKPTRSTEQDYVQTFTPHPLPYQGLYTDEDSLEQPSQLKYVPSTTTPS